MRIQLLLCFLLLGTCPWANAQAKRTTARVQLQERKVEVQVEDAGGGSHAVRRLLRAARDALPHVERAAGFPYPRAWPVRIRVHPDKKACGNEVGYYDHRQRTIHVWNRISDPILVHELAHAWFLEQFAAGYRKRERWLIEGLAHYTMVRALEEAPHLGEAAHVHRVLIDKGLKVAPAGFDPVLPAWRPPFPLPKDPTSPLRAKKLAFYGKAYAFLAVARARGGADLIRRVNGAVAAGKKPVTSEAYLALLLKEAPALKGIAAGWLTPGRRGTRFGYALLEDADGDGLPAGEELLRKTDPARVDSDGDGLGDGEEVHLLRTDPADPRSRPAGYRMRADGAFGDWPRTAIVRADRRGDTAAGAEADVDLLEVRAHVGRHYLHLGFEVRGGLADPRAAYNVGIDLDGDDRFDLIAGFAAGKQTWVGAVYEGFATVDWHPSRLAPRGARGRRAELFLPLEALGVRGRVRLYPYTTWRGAAGHRRADAVGWLRLRLP